MPGPLAMIFDFIGRDGLSAPLNRMGTAAEVNAKRISTVGVASEEAAAKSNIAGRSWSQLTGVTAKLGIELGAAALAFKAFELGTKFQKQMLQIQTLTGGSALEVKNMSQAVLGLAGQVGAAPDKLAVSLYHVESVGLRGGKAIDVVKTAAEGAKIGMADLEETTNALTSTVASGIPGVKNMSQAMGALITIVGAGDMKMSDLNEALGGGILSVVKGYGLSLNDVGAALATFGDNNIRGADAATALRMAVQSLAVPAKTGKKAIAEIGLTMHSLQKDMQEGGLNKAILDLQAHMQAAGITGVQVGGYLTEAFGKRAGIGLSVLMGQVDRFESKVTAIKDGANGFQSKWVETTKTVGFQFDQIKAKVDAQLIKGFDDAAPAIQRVAQFMGTTVPHAISTLQAVLAPLEREVGGGFVTAWHVLGDVLSVVGHVLAGIGGFLRGHKTEVTAFGSAVLAMWAAFKAYQIARTALLAVDAALLRMSASMRGAGASMASMQAGTGAFSARSVAMGTAMLGVGAIVAAVSIIHQKHARQMAIDKQAVDDYTTAIQADNGALGENVRAQAAKALSDDNAFTFARKVGISQTELTSAVMGNAKALSDAKEKLSEYTHESGHSAVASQYLGFILDVNIDRLGKAKVKAADLAAAVKAGAGATHDAGSATGTLNRLTASQLQFQKDLAQAQKQTQITIGDTTYAMRGQATAADVLNAALARLSGDKNAVAESQLALQDSLAAVTDQIKQQAKEYKDHGTSLSANTDEGRKNLEWLHQQIDAINSVASAQIKAGASTDTVTSTLGKNEKALKAAAIAAGLSKTQVAALIKQYAATPKQVDTYIKAHADTATTAAIALQKKLDNLTKEKTALIKLKDDGAPVQNQLKAVQDELNKLNGYTATVAVNVAGTALTARLASTYASQVPVFQRKALGGPVYAGHPYLVGDGFRPELFVPTTNGTILPKMPTGQQTVNITQNINNPIAEPVSVSSPAAVRRAAIALGR